VLALTVPKKAPQHSELGGLSFTPTIGYLYPGTDAFDSTVLYGAKISYDKLGQGIADSIGVDGTLNFFTSKSKIDNSTADGYLFRVDAIYPFLIGKKVVPFIAVGLGGIGTSSASHSELNPLFNYGAGLKYFFENYLALRVDGRQLLVVNNGNIKDNIEISVGLSYFFGKERQKKPVPQPVTKPKDKPVPSLENTPAETLPLPLPLLAPKPVMPEVSAKIISLWGTAQVESLAPATDVSATQGKSALVLTPGTMVVVQSGQPLPSAPVPASPEELERARQAAIIEGQPEPFKVVKIEFDVNRVDVKPKYAKQLKEIVAILKSSPGASVKVEAYTDSSGKNAKNKKFALERANSVRAKLKKLGADPERIATVGYGYTQPSTDTSSTAGRQKKRQPVATVTVLDYTAGAAQVTYPSKPDTELKPTSGIVPAATPTTLPPPTAPAVAEAATSSVAKSGVTAGGTSAVPIDAFSSGHIVGKVLEISGKATIERGRSRLAVRKNSAIQAGDVIVAAAKARIRLLFNDKSTLTLSGKSRLVVRDFIARQRNEGR
jgi:OOP family OmpA-OmpF porin